jgi:hypothetical protein
VSVLITQPGFKRRERAILAVPDELFSYLKLLPEDFGSLELLNQNDYRLVCLGLSQRGRAQSENGKNKKSNGFHFEPPDSFRDHYAGKMMKRDSSYWAPCKSPLGESERIENRSANCPVCAALMIGRSMNLRKLDGLRYAFWDPDFF